MRNTNKCLQAIAILMLTAVMAASAQSYRSSYSRNGDSVYYDGRAIPQADAASFQILGHGYAKDRHNVYLDGKVLEYVDPVGFCVRQNAARRPDDGCRPNGNTGGKGPEAGSPGGDPHHGEHKSLYYKSQWDVYYDGKKIPDASPKSFEELGQGYAKDSFNVYYKGKKVEGAIPSKFKIDHDGYAHDSFSTYRYGKKI